MIYHVSLGTNDLRSAKSFYEAVFAVLGIQLLSDDGMSIDYGVGEVMSSLETPVDGKPASVGKGVHIAFAARDPNSKARGCLCIARPLQRGTGPMMRLRRHRAWVNEQTGTYRHASNSPRGDECGRAPFGMPPYR
jgi:catechol 2,3-dioxygenase-like lactoylglutathione lyase family enzyme